MKTSNIILVLFILQTLNVRAHDYQSVYAHRSALFKNPKNQILGMRIDTIKIATDTILYPFATIQEVSPEGCFSPYKTSWIGEKVVIKPDGTNLFFNREGDTITIKTQASLNEKWIAFQCNDTFRIEASIQSIELENVLGLIDSVKTVGFRVFDQQGNTVNHALNNKKLKISKKYGFVETLNFYLFPDIRVHYPSDHLKKYILVGFTNPKVGIQNFTWLAVYNFNVGDEVHVQELKIGDPTVFPIEKYNKRCIFKYLERTNMIDSKEYIIARKQSIETVYSDSSNLEIIDDTLKSIVKTNPVFDKMPGEAIIDNNNAAYSFYMGKDEFEFKIEQHETRLFFQNENCWSLMTGEGCDPEFRYIRGLGGPYYFCSGYLGDSKKRELVYYKKGDVEWGERLILTDLLKINMDHQIKVYPNPAHDVVTFQLQQPDDTYNIQLFNQTGNLVKYT